jgi:hypothetical protein
MYHIEKGNIKMWLFYNNMEGSIMKKNQDKLNTKELFN